MSAFMWEPLKKALVAAGVDGLDDTLFYQDYLYEMMAEGTSDKPITEQQWEALCSIAGRRRMTHASNLKHIISNVERKKR